MKFCLSFMLLLSSSDNELKAPAVSQLKHHVGPSCANSPSGLCDGWRKRHSYDIHIVLLYPARAEKSASLKMLRRALLSGLEGGWVVQPLDSRQMFYSLL